MILRTFVLDQAEAEAIVRTVRDAVVAGSYLVITHASYDHLPIEEQRRIEDLSVAARTPLRLRGRPELGRLFEGFELVEPGLVYLPLWRPESHADLLLDTPEQAAGYGGVGRKV